MRGSILRIIQVTHTRAHTHTDIILVAPDNAVNKQPESYQLVNCLHETIKWRLSKIIFLN